MSSPLLIVVAGPSGAGKGSIVQRLLAADEDLELSRSWTTRPPRESDPEGWYEYVDRDRFQARVDSDGFVEWAEVFGNLYGTPLPPTGLESDLVLEIDVQGAEQVRQRSPDAVVVFVRTPDRAEQRRRLQERGDPADLIEQRLAAADVEEAIGAAIADLVVVNDDLEVATAEVAGFISATRARLERLRGSR